MLSPERAGRTKPSFESLLFSPRRALLIWAKIAEILPARERKNPRHKAKTQFNITN